MKQLRTEEQFFTEQETRQERRQEGAARLVHGAVPLCVRAARSSASTTVKHIRNRRDWCGMAPSNQWWWWRRSPSWWRPAHQTSARHERVEEDGSREEIKRRSGQTRMCHLGTSGSIFIAQPTTPARRLCLSDKIKRCSVHWFLYWALGLVCFKIFWAKYNFFAILHFVSKHVQNILALNFLKIK